MGLMKRLGLRPDKEPASAAEEAIAVAEAFVASMREAGVTAPFDYSEESVFCLDALIDRGWDSPTEDRTYRTVVPAMAAYLGEVMVRSLGGRWLRSRQGLSVRFDRGGDIDPSDVVRRRFADGEPQYIAMFYAALRHSLGIRRQG